MFLSDEQYIHAKELYENTTEPTPLLADLSAWALKKYGVNVIDYICDKRSDDAFAKALMTALNTKWDKQKIKEHSKKFSLEAMAEKYQAVYEKIKR